MIKNAFIRALADIAAQCDPMYYVGIKIGLKIQAVTYAPILRTVYSSVHAPVSEAVRLAVQAVYQEREHG